MQSQSQGNLYGRISAAAAYFSGLQIPVYAAHAGYFIVLASFPTLVLLLALLRYTGLQVDHLTALLEDVLPSALMPAARKLVLNTYRNTSGAVISVSALTALWSASRGIHGLLTGLEGIYQVRQRAGYFRRRLTSVVYTFLFLIALLLTLLLQVFGQSLLGMLSRKDGALYALATEVVDLRLIFLLGMQTALFTGIFMALPGQRNPLRCSWPGALLASAGWLMFSKLYSVYVQKFSGYADIYGSVYVVALSLLWLYCCLSIVFYGGALNHFLLKRTGNEEK